MKLEKAMITLLDDDAVDESRGLTKTFYVQFNPTEYTRTKGAQIAEIAIPGIDSPILQFVRGQNEKLTLDLFFDTTTFLDTAEDKTGRSKGMGADADDVSERTRPFYELVKMQPETHAPPRIRFTWGKSFSFEAVVESVQQKFTLFSPEGIALRATLSLTFREYKTLEDQLKELKLASADHSTQRVVQRGETLSRIAGQEYGDPGEWRRIADANPQVDNPRRPAPGTALSIPPLEEAP